MAERNTNSIKWLELLQTDMYVHGRSQELLIIHYWLHIRKEVSRRKEIRKQVPDLGCHHF